MSRKKIVCILVVLGCLLCVVWRPQRITLKVGIFAGSNWDVPNGDCYKIIDQAIERYEEENPDIHIEYESGILKEDISMGIAVSFTEDTDEKVTATFRKGRNKKQT